MEPERPRPLSETAGLLARCRDGDRSALNELLVRDLEWIRGYAHRHLDGIVRRHADTNDVVQEVMVRTLKYGPRFLVDDRGMFRRLMARIVTNTLVSMARGYSAQVRSPERERRIETDSVLYLEGDSPRKGVTEPPERVERAQEADWVRLALSLLDARDQEVLRLRDWESQSFPEIGEQVGLTDTAARMCYQRGVKKLGRWVTKLKSGQIGLVLEESEAGDRAG